MADTNFITFQFTERSNIPEQVSLSDLIFDASANQLYAYGHVFDFMRISDSFASQKSDVALSLEGAYNMDTSLRELIYDSNELLYETKELLEAADDDILDAVFDVSTESYNNDLQLLEYADNIKYDLSTHINSTNQVFSDIYQQLEDGISADSSIVNLIDSLAADVSVDLDDLFARTEQLDASIVEIRYDLEHNYYAWVDDNYLTISRYELDEYAISLALNQLNQQVTDISQGFQDLKDDYMARIAALEARVAALEGN